MRRRFAGWVVLTALVAGCATTASQPSVDRTDVWFMQHMIPHLLQDTSIVYLTRDRLADPELARLADRSYRRDQAHLAELQGWLAERGLAPHGHSHQPGDTLRRSDLERLSRLDGAALDLSFVEVMTARHRAGGKLATAEARDGGIPQVRRLAQQLLAEQQAQIGKLQAWRRASSRAPGSHRAGYDSALASGRPVTDRLWT